MSDTEDDGMRDFTRQLFTDDGHGDNWPTAGGPVVEPAQPKQGNHVPREGSTPSSGGGDWETRQWVNDLFTHSGVLG